MAVLTSALVDREDLLRELTAVVDRTDGGACLVVTGDPGVGKSALLAEVSRRSQAAGRRVLDVVGVEAETRLPWAGLHQLLRPVLSGVGALPAPQRAALTVALGLGAAPAPDPYLVALATVSLLSTAAAERPLTVLADDVQWLDLPSHLALAFLARRVAPDPIAVVGVLRTGHAGPLAAAGLPGVTVGPLPDDAARALLARHGADLPDVVWRTILAAAAGNPLALVELPKAWRAAAGPMRPSPAPPPTREPAVLPVTARLERSFAGRLRGLPPVGRDVVLVAAVDGTGELATVLHAASILRGTAVGLPDLGAVTGADLLRVDGATVAFRHPLVRSAVLATEDAERRQRAHAAVAAVPGGEPYRRTWHRAHAVVGPDDAVADALEDVVSTAVARGAAGEAIHGLQRAAQLTTDPARRGHRLLRAAEHAFDLGRADLVADLVGRASRLPLGELDRVRRAWVSEIFHDGAPGDPVRVHQLCDAAQRALGVGGVELAHKLLHGAALRCWWADPGPAARARVVDVAHRVPDHGRSPRVVAAIALAEPLRAAAEVLEHLAGFAVEDVPDADDLRLLGTAAHAVGHPVLAVEYLGRAATGLRAAGRLGLLPHVLIMQVPALLTLGDWRRARDVVEEGRRVGEETGQPIWNAGALICSGWAAALRGERDEALRIAAEAELAAEGLRLDLLTVVHLTRGAAWAATGAYPEAYDALRPLFDPAAPGHHLRSSYAAVPLLAEAAVHTGRRADARRLLAAHVVLGETCPAPALRIGLAYARAVLADDGDPAAAEERYRRALGDDLVRWPWMRARLDLAYGSWLRRQRRPAESRAHLRSAHLTLELIGATHWAGQAAAELRAAGERGPEQTRPAVAADRLLSAQELQIARLAAQGLTNREIGHQLYLSPRTVGSHLYRLFPKLGITSRAQLGDRLRAR